MNGWKVTAIIFIILFVLETILFIFIISVGTGIVAKESECAINICEKYEKYYYDYTENICYCFENDEIAFQKYMVD